jgi:hypothetical protein
MGGRRLFVLGSAVSFVLFVVATGLWLRSYWYSEGVVSRYRIGPVQRGLESSRGRIAYHVTWSSYGRQIQMEGVKWFSFSVGPPGTIERNFGERTTDLSLAGFSFLCGDYRAGGWLHSEQPHPYWAIIVPYWFLVFVTGLLPLRCGLLMRGRWRYEKRRRLGLCEHCGYDLRATPERCPECGAPAQISVQLPR